MLGCERPRSQDTRSFSEVVWLGTSPSLGICRGKTSINWGSLHCLVWLPNGNVTKFWRLKTQDTGFWWSAEEKQWIFASARFPRSMNSKLLPRPISHLNGWLRTCRTAGNNHSASPHPIDPWVSSCARLSIWLLIISASSRRFNLRKNHGKNQCCYTTCCLSLAGRKMACQSSNVEKRLPPTRFASVKVCFMPMSPSDPGHVHIIHGPNIDSKRPRPEGVPPRLLDTFHHWKVVKIWAISPTKISSH